jgi:two-component system, NtrC family, sensor kinase
MCIIELRRLIFINFSVVVVGCGGNGNMLLNETEKDHPILALIVDDDPNDLKLLSYYLSHDGYEVETAMDGMEALNSARRLIPDIIILDVYMPELNGIEMCRRLKSLEETRHIPVICVTGMDDKDVKLECLDAGANVFISKPVNMTEMLIKARNLVRLKEFENIKIKSDLIAETFAAVEKIKREWEESMDCIKDVVILIDADSHVLRCNKTLSLLTGKSYEEIISHDWQEVLIDGGFSNNPDFESCNEICHDSGRWFVIAKYKIDHERGSSSLVSVVTLNDITESKKIMNELIQSRELLSAKNEELDRAIRDLKMTQSQMLQQEKMASIGQIAAGVAHEINNPMGYIISNFQSLKKYAIRISDFLDAQTSAWKECAKKCGHMDEFRRIEEMRDRNKIDHIISDIDSLVTESLEGADRVKMIVRDLKNFSRIDEPELKYADINSGIESTLNIIWNEIKYKVTLHKEYGDLPPTKCNPGQLNQVFLNILVNAAQAIEKQGEIGIKTWHKDERIFVSITDTGCGIPDTMKEKIFEPFITTKEVGKGTGLGLSIAYDIVRKHRGEITLESVIGKGSTFTVMIPVQGQVKEKL